MSGLDFLKMHGLGNDFVVVDGRVRFNDLPKRAIRRIADRHLGVGCDQFIRIEPSDRADAFMRIWNPDASEAEACGNATRCVAHLLIDENGKDTVHIETLAGVLECRRNGSGISVDMGPARTGWADIPLARETDTLSLHLGDPAPGPATAVNIGNPHMVFFVDDAEAVDLAKIGPVLEHHKMFPERANVSFAQVLDDKHVRLRVWERSAGATRACGSAACATGVAAFRRGFAGRHSTVILDGGPLEISWRESDDHVLMAGPVALAFRGHLPHDMVS
jgi:diaminopimelate epimerase